MTLFDRIALVLCLWGGVSIALIFIWSFFIQRSERRQFKANLEWLRDKNLVMGSALRGKQ